MPPASASIQHYSKHDVRVRRFLLAASAYACCLPLLAIAHLLGLIPTRTVIEIGGAMIATNAALYALFHTGMNERFRDPSLTWLQVLSATAVLMYAVFQFDQERGLALMMCLVVLSFGTFRFSTREFFTAAGIVLAGYALVINLLMWLKPAGLNVWLEAFRWLTLAFVLPCFALVGGRISDLRQRVRDAEEREARPVCRGGHEEAADPDIVLGGTVRGRG